MAQTQVYSLRIMVREYKYAKEKKNRRDLGLACQMRNCLAKKRSERKGGREWDLNWMNQFSFDNCLWLH